MIARRFDSGADLIEDEGDGSLSNMSVRYAYGRQGNV